ncbi:penicillin-insensitive murein endopeptidase [Mongoliimonas terrestris]|uniref:penicillin-insensitive murein endopeptidase n=1 Tax=Mongoliimonas terrestris TaxID=1709001 RepID=UPI000949812F|nr:penicillin-insensitive murein endopeptidase [Mongoliimonas terrestris]
MSSRPVATRLARLRVILVGLLAAVAVAAAAGGPARAEGGPTPAKVLFGAVTQPAPLKARAIGSYARGCLAGAVALPVNGARWQVMRLSRNRNWGHPDLVRFLERLAVKAPSVGWNGLLVGDLAQPRGGPMLTGHASHQIGLDADIWLTPMPPRTLSADERESLSATSMLANGGKGRFVDPAIFTAAHYGIIRAAAHDKAVDRIFVNRGIKKALCEMTTGDRSWLRVVRPWWGHDYHFHVRLGCPAGSVGCKAQDAPPQGDGCGAELDSWFVEKPAPPPSKPRKPAPEITLADLPKACGEVLVTD